MSAPCWPAQIKCTTMDDLRNSVGPYSFALDELRIVISDFANSMERVADSWAEGT